MNIPTSRVQVMHREGLCILTLDHMESGNSPSEELARELLAALASGETDPGLDTVLLTGPRKGIWKTVPDTEPEGTALALPKRISALPADAVRRTKLALAAPRHDSLEEQLELERELQMFGFGSGEFREGPAAFREGRRSIFHKVK